jgi:hypothetical protein
MQLAFRVGRQNEPSRRIYAKGMPQVDPDSEIIYRKKLLAFLSAMQKKREDEQIKAARLSERLAAEKEQSQMDNP